MQTNKLIILLLYLRHVTKGGMVGSSTPSGLVFL